MYIHEPIHGEIKLSELALKIIDHPYYDRTHYIYQTGTAYKVFPSATHSRKVHMIGTYGMTKNLLDNLSQTHRIDEHTKELIAIGGLCHDIGHGPGSHVFDKHIVPKLIEDGVIEKDHTWVTHEQRSIFILKEIAKQINISEQDTEFICNVIEPPENNKDWRFSIVNNKKHGIDTDKLDYILRDNYMLGLKLNIDIDKIIKHSKIIDGEWSFERRIYNELLNIILVRYRIHSSLNQFQIVKFDLSYRNIMLDGKLYEDISSIFKSKNIHEFCKLTDSYVMQNGNHDLISNFNKRRDYTYITDKKNTSDEDYLEILSLNINICKTGNDHNPLENVPFYDYRTNMHCTISQNQFNIYFPSKETLSYIFKKET
tara:strand:- start:5448 stop:6557 length:1110 start_codon:yes stop_codon:yes gene_type:complete